MLDFNEELAKFQPCADLEGARREGENPSGSEEADERGDYQRNSPRRQ